MFLNEHPNGNIRKEPRRVTGHNYPKKRKRTKLDSVSIAASLDLLVSSSDEDDNEEITEIDQIDLGGISSDEWTDSYEEDF